MGEGRAGGRKRARSGGQTAREVAQFTDEDFFQQGDLAVEEVADAGEDDDRQDSAAAPRRASRRAGRRRRSRHGRRACRRGTSRDRLLLGRRADEDDPARLIAGAEALRGLDRDIAAEGKAAEQARQAGELLAAAPGATTASASSTSPRPSSHTPSEAPTPRKLKRTLPSRGRGRRARSSARPCCRACRRTAGAGGRRPRGRAAAPAGRSIAHSMRPAGPAICSRTVLGVIGDGALAADVGRQQQARHDLAALQVRVDDLVDVAARRRRCTRRLRDRRRRPGRRRSGSCSPTC